MPEELDPVPDVEAMRAETEMFADVLEEMLLGVLGQRDAEPWYERAARRLSRGVAPTLLAFFDAAHAAGVRQQSRAEALAAATELLLVPDRKRAGPYDFPTDLAILVVTRGVADEVLKRMRGGVYHSADEVVGSAMHAIHWAETDPMGRVQLLKFAVGAGLVDGEEERLIPAEVVFARARERVEHP